jgi:quinone-modifying oxidoreductase subunit QmoC
VLNALRAAAIRHFAFPGWLGALAASPKGLPLLLLLPVLIFTAMMLAAPRTAFAGEMEFAHLFPLPRLEALFFTVAGLVLLGFAVGAARFVRALRAAGAGGELRAGLMPTLKEIATHERFRQCGEASTRRWGHLLTLWGFLGLAVMGTIVGLGTMTGIMHTPLPLLHPLKIFANLCAVVILIGCLVLLADRTRRAASAYFDWLFLWTLLGVAATGIASELLRLGQTPVMYGVYFVHLVLVFALFVYAPYTKFAHLLYRTLALAATRRKT